METAEDQVLTVPNLLSALRLACVPLFVILLFRGHHRFAAAALLAVLGATDWVDGWVARRLGQVSAVGKVLDPTADRVLLAVAVISIGVDGSVPLWLCVAVAVREAVVSLAVLGLAAAGARRIDVIWLGKAGTLGLMFAFPLFLVSHSGVGWHAAAHVLAWLFAVPALVLSWWAAASYVPLAKRALAEGRVRSVP
ncbi:MAG TPA: CDP-alcohol phosphatidyltransferase family protein [Acidimicrobiales bacterium]|nr:CDP-alcohol phosphatidyltransferase family protein [Acidimicrobiales bacterium]